MWILPLRIDFEGVLTSLSLASPTEKQLRSAGESRHEIIEAMFLSNSEVVGVPGDSNSTRGVGMLVCFGVFFSLSLEKNVKS